MLCKHFIKANVQVYDQWFIYLWGKGGICALFSIVEVIINPSKLAEMVNHADPPS
jgi:hypothetical protein